MDLTPSIKNPVQRIEMDLSENLNTLVQDNGNYQNEPNEEDFKVYTVYWFNVFKSSQNEEDMIDLTFKIPYHYTVSHVIEMVITSLNQKLQEQQNNGHLVSMPEKYQLRRAKKSNKPDLDMPAFDFDSTVLKTKEVRFVLCHASEEEVYNVKPTKYTKNVIYSQSSFNDTLQKLETAANTNPSITSKFCCCFFGKKKMSEGQYVALESSE